jgi:hypothetical protein
MLIESSLSAQTASIDYPAAGLAPCRSQRSATDSVNMLAQNARHRPRPCRAGYRNPRSNPNSSPDRRQHCPATIARRAFPNPWLEKLTDETEDGWEGCLSVPGMRDLLPVSPEYGMVVCSRMAVRSIAKHRDFTPSSSSTSSTHLDGVLYSLRIRDMTKFGFADALFTESDIGALESE